jgi:hypothetical protein
MIARIALIRNPGAFMFCNDSFVEKHFRFYKVSYIAPDKSTALSDNKKDLPPFFKSWNQFYFFVACWLVTLIILFYFFTQYFS